MPKHVLEVLETILFLTHGTIRSSGRGQVPLLLEVFRYIGPYLAKPPSQKFSTLPNCIVVFVPSGPTYLAGPRNVQIPALQFGAGSGEHRIASVDPHGVSILRNCINSSPLSVQLLESTIYKELAFFTHPIRRRAVRPVYGNVFSIRRDRHFMLRAL